MAIIVILQVKVLSSPSKKELKNVTSISYSVVESPHVTRGKKKDSVSHGKIEGALLLCQIFVQGLPDENSPKLISPIWPVFPCICVEMNS